jgi:hypothetical protein
VLDLFGIDINHFAASGAFKLFYAVFAIAVAITIVTIAVAIVTFAITIAVAIVFAFVEILFNFAEIFVDLFDILVEHSGLVFKILYGKCEILKQIENSGKKLAFVGILVVIHTVKKTLEVGSLFGNCHFTFLSALYTLKIFAGTGVYLNYIAFVNKNRYSDNSAGFNSCVLGNVGSGVALYAGFGFGDLKFNEHGRFNRENTALVGKQTALVTFLNELKAIGKLIAVKRNLIKGLHIHKVVKIAVAIGIFHILLFNGSGRELCGGVERCFNNGTGDNVSHLGTNESRTFTGFNVLEFNNLHYLSIHFESKAVSEIACR